MKWYVIQKLETGGRFSELTAGHSCFVLETCARIWHTHSTLLQELKARGYMNCMLLRCTEEEMLRITSEENMFRRRRIPGMGPFDCLTLTSEEVNELLTLMHVTDRYQMVRCPAPSSLAGERKSQTIMRGTLSGLSGQVICDRANLRKFIPTEILPGVKLIILLPAEELRPLSKVEYEHARLNTDTGSRWYMVLCKNEQLLQDAFRLTPRSRTQEGIFTQELNLMEFHYGMSYPEGISQCRYYYHAGEPLPKHYFFVFTTLPDIQFCRLRNPYAPIRVVWHSSYEPVALTSKEFGQLVNAIEGRPQELSRYMQNFINSLKEGDRLGILLTNIQEVPLPGTLVRKKKNKLEVVDNLGHRYQLKPEHIKPL